MIDENICKDMLNQSKKSLKFTYPKSGIGFAVAVLTKKGNIYTGVSYQSDTYTRKVLL